MSLQPPKIDKRTYDEIVAQTEELAQKFTDWHPRSDGKPDAGRALIRIFGRMAALVSDRLNQVPDKNFLAFLDLIGTQIHPPQPARVPLTFTLVEQSPVDAFVPARTQVAAPAVEDEEEVVFELDDELVVVRTQLQAVYVRQPVIDCYSDNTAAATGVLATDYPAFEAQQPMEHHFYLACDELFTLPSEKAVTLTIRSAAALDLQKLPITWSYWDAEGSVWKTLKGRVEGLTVTPDPSLPLIKVAPGKAINSQGEEIVFPQEQEINLLAEQGQTVLVLLEKTSPQPTVIISHSPDLATLKLDTRVCLACLSISSQGKVSYAPLAQARTGRSEWPVVFKKLPPLSVHEIDEQSAAWLRARLDTPLPLDRTNLPQIDSMTTSFTLQQGGLAPDQCLFNSVPLDLSKDFYPFGEQPRFNDTFYLASQEVFSQPGAVVTVQVKLSAGKDAIGTNDLEIAWEFWNGATSKWERLGKSSPSNPKLEDKSTFTDATQAFTQKKGETREVTFTLPPNLVSHSMNGQDNYWLRARISKGSYGEAAKAQQRKNEKNELLFKDGFPIYELIPASFAPPSIESLTLSYTLTKTKPIATLRTYNDCAYVTPSLPFQPFMPTEDQQTALYLGFDQPFPNRPITLYAQVESLAPGKLSNRATRIKVGEVAASGQKKLKVEQVAGFRAGQAVRIAPGNSSQEDAEIVAIQPEQNSLGGEITLRENLAYSHGAQTRIEVLLSTPRLLWEYHSTGGWKSLGVLDETDAFTEPGSMLFIGPEDLIPHQEFGQKLYWLRVRWDGGEFLVQPHLRRLLTNTTWASQVQKLEQEGLGSSTGNPNQRFFTSHYPVLPEQRLEVQETLSPAAQEAIQARDKGALTIILDDAGEIEAMWVRWQEVPDFYGSGKGDRHYMLNHLTGEVQFGDGQRGMVPPLGRQNIRLAQYRTGGGKQGNKPAETITLLKTTLPYIDHVTNLEAASGAADQESLERVKERGPKQLRHRGRAVTAQDIEDLAFEASPDVARARAIVPNFPEDLEWLPIYHLPITGSGKTIKVQMSWTETTVQSLQVAIYGPGQATPWYKQPIQKNRELTYTIPAGLPPDSVTTWRVTVSNPNDQEATGGSGTIAYGDTAQTIEFSRLNNHPHSQVVDAGRVDLVLVPQSLANQPTPSLGLQNRVHAYIQARCAATLALQVTEPDWIEVTVKATVAPTSFQGADAMRERAIHILTRFLHPLTGGAAGRGWAFGRRPRKSDLYALLESIEGVDFVKKLEIIEQSSAQTSKPFLIYSGSHQILLE
jgi:Baseplate J-like protein